MADDLLTLISGVLPMLAAAVAALIATRVRVLPEVIDISIIPTAAGTASMAFSTYGAVRRFKPDRVARLALGGTVAGGILGTAGLGIGLLIHVL